MASFDLGHFHLTSKYTFHDHLIPVDGREIPVRALAPKPKDGEDKMFLFCIGSMVEVGSRITYSIFHHDCDSRLDSWNADLDDYWLRHLCIRHRLAIVNVNYR